MEIDTNVPGGEDESGSKDVEIDTAGLDNDKEIDLDRSGVSGTDETNEDDSKEANFSGHEDLDTKPDDDPASFVKGRAIEPDGYSGTDAAI
ncbi:MAG TPA: hypothetical protein VNJ08_08090 [Bacteriovoracaceae bacterium]|nr:hypothetical protein [Bacteriovoracaceae bacterium]